MKICTEVMANHAKACELLRRVYKTLDTVHAEGVEELSEDIGRFLGEERE
jgi:hypothetical protein